MTKEKGIKSKRERQIIAAALQVFSQKGYSGATTKEIAEQAGLAEGTIFRYFKTKKDLLLAVTANLAVGSLVDTIKDLPLNDEEEFLKAVLRNRLELVKKNLETIKILLVESQFHPELRKVMAEDVVLKAIGIMEKYMDAKIKEGTFRQINSSVAIKALAGMLQMFVFWQHIFEGNRYLPYSDEEIIDIVVDIFLNGVRAPQKGVEV